MYLDDIIPAISKHLPADRLPEGDSSGLLRLYAMLVRAKGPNVTQADVHDAWAVWMAERDPTHKSLIPYDELSDDNQAQDRVFADALRSAAEELKRSAPPTSAFTDVLFPSGPPKLDSPSSQVLELYKIIVASSEALVGRRQAVNTFFLTINGALLTAYGLVAQNAGTYPLSGAALIVIAVAGGVLCLAWRSLITSFGQLNRGKFRVINTIERYLSVSIYAAEWEALGRGENPKIYRSFTSREIWVPSALFGMHVLAVVIAIFVLVGVTSTGQSAAEKNPAGSTTTAPVTQAPAATAPATQSFANPSSASQPSSPTPSTSPTSSPATPSSP